VARKSISEHRSGCPVGVSLEVLGDRWSLLIVRDMMVRGYRTFREFQHAGEGIASNILADRLRKLEAGEILTTEPAAEDGRSAHYRLTAKGIALAPVLLDLLIWGAQHEETGAPCAVIAQMAENREAVLAEAYRRWAERDPTPLLPRFDSAETLRGLAAVATTTAKTKRTVKTKFSPKPKTSPKGRSKS